MLDERGQPLHPTVMGRIDKVWGGEAPQDFVPRCFPTKQGFLLWLRSWSPNKDPEVTFCTDCTRDRRDAMVAHRRCRFPNTTFDVDNDGWTRGNRA